MAGGLFNDVIKLRPGSPELNAVRERALAGDPGALKTYAYYGAWVTIQHDAYIPFKKRLPTFKALCKLDLIEVSLGR